MDVGLDDGPRAPRTVGGVVLWPASLLGDRLDERRADLRATLPVGRVVGPADVAALAVQLMTNAALTGATYDIDEGSGSSPDVLTSGPVVPGGPVSQPGCLPGAMPRGERDARFLT